MATQVQSILLEMFPSRPFAQVVCEYYVNFQGRRLFFDFYVKSINLFVEVQGRQHTKFVKHFHQDKETFLQQKERDNLKRIWAERNGYLFIRINYNEKVTKKLIVDKIYKAMHDSEGFCG